MAEGTGDRLGQSEPLSRLCRALSVVRGLLLIVLRFSDLLALATRLMLSGKIIISSLDSTGTGAGLAGANACRIIISSLDS